MTEHRVVDTGERGNLPRHALVSKLRARHDAVLDAGGRAISVGEFINACASHPPRFDPERPFFLSSRSFGIPCRIPVDQQKLIFKGRALVDDQTPAEHGIKNMDTIHLVGDIRGD